MRIVQLYSGQNTGTGDFVYRIQQPAKGLAAVAGVQVLNVDLIALRKWSLILEADVLILHHIADPDLLPVISRRRQAGRPTVYEIADHFRVSHQHLADAERTGPPERHTVMETLVARCDLVQTTSDALAQCYQDLHDRFLILPNLIEERRLNLDPRRGRDNFVVGWGGSDRHDQDVGSIADALVEWLCRNDHTQLAVMGSHRIREHFSGLPPDKLRHAHPGDLENYLTFLDSLDVGLAPMLPTGFNACRSDLKFLEYASRAVIPLCRNFGPYSQLPPEIALRFETPVEMVARLDHLRHDSEFRARALQRAVNYVRSQRLFADHDWAARVKAYAFVAGRHPARVHEQTDDCLLSPDATARLNLALKAPTDPKSQKILKAAISDDRDNYQLFFFQATILLNVGQTDSAISFLKKTHSLNRRSIRVAQLLVRSLILSGETQAAAAVLDEALEIEPAFPILLSLQGLLLLLQGQEDQACDVLDRCLRAAPRLVEPRQLRARLASKSRDWQRLEKLADELQRLTPKSAEWAILRAKVCRARGDERAATEYAEAALNLEPNNKAARALMRCPAPDLF